MPLAMFVRALFVTGRSGSRCLLAALIAAGLVLQGCAHVPVVDESRLLHEASGVHRLKVYGTRGPLSARQSRVVLARVAAQAPDAGALVRHLAVEQIVADSPLYTGNAVRVLVDGAQTFPAMFAAIEGAKHFIYLEYYTFEDVRSGGRDLGDLLAQKSRAGVHVCVIYDAFGSLGTPAEFLDRLHEAGVQLVRYNPVNPLKAAGHYAPNQRDHRKILIADDEVAIVGGVNLSTTYESVSPLSREPASEHEQPGADHAVWHDLDVQIRGPGVRELSQLFREHWREQQGPPLAREDLPHLRHAQGKEIVRVLGSSPRKLASRYYVSVLTAIRTAQSSIWMTAAYFVPTRQEMRGLEAAARRGVDVRILLPSHSDVAPVLEIQRSYYPQLLRAGIKVYERSDGIVHSKSIVIDGVWSLVGSSNFDQRSVLFNDEVDAVIVGQATADQLQRAMLDDIDHARRIGWKDVRSRGVLQRFKAWFWRLGKQLF